jgi:nucleoid-associated protein YgaU
VLFNPEEYTVSKGNQFAEAVVPGLGAPILQFVAGGLTTLDLELLVDTYEAHADSGSSNAAGDDVRTLTRRISALLEIDPQIHAPPIVLFTWGTLYFRCVLTKVTERFVMFLPSGVPVRARLQVTFSEFTTAELEAKETKRETADYSKIHIVSEGETLSSIAASAYRDASAWRPIALRNGIDDPRTLAPGNRLAIPRLPYRDRETGEVVAR